jgi:hypothetical protein
MPEGNGLDNGIYLIDHLSLADSRQPMPARPLCAFLKRQFQKQKLLHEKY